MPAEPRRASRKATSEEDIEAKRARGELSCAECRRLKLKCDKKVPCGSCVRRGCTTICPNGSLLAGQGTRFVLADTEQLHRKIAEMSERIRQLEDALAIFQSGISTDRHPLLRDELLTVKFGPEVRRSLDDEQSRNALSQSIDALGTLTIGERGETKYIGRSGGSEALIMANPCNIDNTPSLPPEVDDIELDLPDLSQDIHSLAFTFNFSLTPESHDAIMDKLESYLPPQPRAWALCETYLEQFTWWFRPIKRDELINEILIPIYRTVADPAKYGYHRKDESDSARCPHLLATLFMVLAVGALVDLTLPACSTEAEKYYRLGRMALSLRSVFDSPELETVQAMGLMAGYHSLCSFRYTLESAWTLSSLASKLAQSIGLHQDSAQWKLDDMIVQRRRNLFWELFILEMMHCLALGRPPSIALKHIDCKIPTDEESTAGESGHEFPGYWKWRFLFSQQVYAHIVDALVNARAPAYETVLDLDRQIRQTTLPPVRLYLRPDEDDYNNPSLCMQGYLMSQYRSVAMIYIHRTFFAQALLDHPDNPLASPYAPSFLAANRCASVVIKSFIHYYERCPNLIGRFWEVWTHAFSAGIILGLTVCRAPGVSMAASALVEMELVISLFAKGSTQSFRARQAHAILQVLKGKADRAYIKYRNRHGSPMLDIQLNFGPEFEVCPNRVAFFGGQTSVMSAELLNRRRAPRHKKSVSSPGPVPPPAGSPPPGGSPASTPGSAGVPQPLSDAFAQVHPSLVEYLALFPSGASLAVVDPPAAGQVPLGGVDARMNGSGMNGAGGMQGVARTPTVPSDAPGFGAFPNAPSFQPYYAGMPDAAAHEQQLPQMDGGLPPGFGGALPDAGLVALGVPDFGFTEDVMMTDHWMDLMRQTGVFDGVEGFPAGVPEAPQDGSAPSFSF